jgi:sugar lactone lactonase YvrE
MRIFASGLRFPEGPIAMADGSVLVVEIERGTLTRAHPDGRLEVVAEIAGAPNGAALGPDGRILICNSGGYGWIRDGATLRPGRQSKTYAGGGIDVVDPATGKVERLYERCGENPLKGPNDLVFDGQGGFWFTDMGKLRQRDLDLGFIYWARADGSEIREVIGGMITPNGIGLSPDGKRLYVAETIPGRLWSWEIVAGDLRCDPHGRARRHSSVRQSRGRRVRQHLPGGARRLRDPRNEPRRHRRETTSRARHARDQSLFRWPGFAHGLCDLVSPRRDRCARLAGWGPRASSRRLSELGCVGVATVRSGRALG